MKNKDYLVTVNSLSGYFEIDRLRQSISKDTILKLRSIFGRFGSPDNFTTDNAAQFSSKEFATLMHEWRIKHITSSPHYPRANGQAEAAVKIAKQLMEKAQASGTDIKFYKMLLDYRNRPRQGTGFSPLQVLMQRNTRMATLPSAMCMSDTDHKARYATMKRQETVRKHHDKNVLDVLLSGTSVWYMH